MTTSRGPEAPGMRLRIRPWRDPRLLVGMLLVLGSTVLGARVVAASDDTVEYWTLSAAVSPGDPVIREALAPTRVRLSADTRGIYLRTDEEFPAPLEDLQWARGGSAGALVDRAALESRATGSRQQVPLGVTEGASPVDLRRGDVVDVWVGPGPGDEPGREAERVLEGVRVAHAGDDSTGLGRSLAQTVLVDVARDQLKGAVVGTLASGHITLVRVS